MARPDTSLTLIDDQQAGWNQTVDDMLAKVRDLGFINPSPEPLAHRTTPDSGSVLLSTLDPADYKWCRVLIVDPASPSTNGYYAFSNGTNWIYTKSNANV